MHDDRDTDLQRLLGREEELARVSDMARRLANGRGSVSVLLGDRGSGKSALLREAIRLTGELVPDVRAVHVPSGIIEADTVGAIRNVLAVGLGDSNTEIGGVIERLASGGDALGVDDPQLLRAGLEVARSMSEERPLVVTVDDLPVADSGLLATFTSLAAGLATMPVMVVVTSSLLAPEGFEAIPVGPLWVHRLGPLPPAACVQVTRRAAPVFVPRAVATTIGRLTGGNPGDIVEVCTMLDDARLTGMAPLPDPLPGTQVSAGVYRQWWAAQSEGHRRAVLCAAGASELTSEVLRTCTDIESMRGPDGRSVLSHVRGQTTFRDARLPSAVTALTPREEIAAAQARLLEHAEAGSLEHTRQLLRSESAPAGEVLRHAVRHTRSQLKLGNLPTALKLSAQTLQHPGEHAPQANLLGGIAALGLGHPGHAAALLSAALRVPADSSVLHTTYFSLILAMNQRDGTLPIDTARSAIGRLESADPRLAGSIACLAARLCVDHGDMTSAADYLNQARTLSATTASIGTATDTDSLDAAELELTEAYVHGLTRHETPSLRPVLSTDVRGWSLAFARVTVLSRAERWDEVRAAVSELRHRGQHHRAGIVEASLALLALRLHLARWELRQAEEVIDHTFSSAPLHAVEHGIGIGLAARALCLRGRTDDATEWLDDARQIAQQSPVPQLRASLARARAQFAVIHGDHARALDLLTDALALDPEWGPTNTDLRADLVLAHLRCGSVDGARSVVAQMRSDGAAAKAVDEFLRRLLLMLDENFIDSVETASVAARRLIPGHEAKLLEVAEQRLALVSQETHEGIPLAPNALQHRRQFLKRASEQYRTSGANALASALDARLTALAQTIDAPASGVALLTAEEYEIAQMVRAGASNKQVASALYLSVRTVELRLTHVYRKLGVQSRGQLRDVPNFGSKTTSPAASE